MYSTNHNESSSMWMDLDDDGFFEAQNFPPLSENIRTDVCIIGAGISGLTTAYLLAKEGKKVCILEDSTIASGQTSRTTAHVVTALDARYTTIEKYHGLKNSQIAADSHRMAIEKIKSIVYEENIPCQMQSVDGFLMSHDNTPDILRKEFSAAQRAGLFDVELTGQCPYDFDKNLYLRFPNQLQFHILEYMQGIAKAFLKLGGEIHCNTHAIDIKGGIETSVQTRAGFTVYCQSVVVATNSPINDIFAIHTKQAPYRTYVLGIKIPKHSVPQNLFWDTDEPFHYVRVASKAAYDILIVGGEDHKTGQLNTPSKCYENLRTWAQTHFPMCEETLHSWSGQIMKSVDGLAYIGHNPMDYENVYVITGDSGNGLTHGTIGGILITDQIMKRKNPWSNLYEPSRINLRSAGEFMKENINVASQYMDWLRMEDSEYIDSIPKDSGAILQDGLKKVALYKDEHGRVSAYSAACPHLGGLVAWNEAEKSWDCPCHGSRFDCHGHVIEGPAIEDLTPMEEFVQDKIAEKATEQTMAPTDYLLNPS